MVAQSPSRQVVQLTRDNVGLELSIPDFGVECREPVTKCSQFLRGEILDLPFKLLNSTHNDSLSLYQPPAGRRI